MEKEKEEEKVKDALLCLIEGVKMEGIWDC